jgi:hypothetical protein
MIERNGEDWIEVTSVDQRDPDFDSKFWEAQSTEMKFRAAWEMVVLAHELKGGDPAELRLQRSPVIVRAL